MARLVEGDADARAILAESGRAGSDDDVTYGVWAARFPSAELRATPTRRGWSLRGTKAFCSGSGVIERALVTAEAPDGHRLFEVATGDVVAGVVPDSWPAVGMTDSVSETLVFDGAELPPASAVGPPGFYTGRPGFWFGACGVAACWFGGARGLVDAVVRHLGPDPDRVALAELGRLSAHLWAMRRLLPTWPRRSTPTPGTARPGPVTGRWPCGRSSTTGARRCSPAPRPSAGRAPSATTRARPVGPRTSTSTWPSTTVARTQSVSGRPPSGTARHGTDRRRRSSRYLRTPVAAQRSARATRAHSRSAGRSGWRSSRPIPTTRCSVRGD